MRTKKVERNNIRAGGQGEFDKTLASKYSLLLWRAELITTTGRMIISCYFFDLSGRGKKKLGDASWVQNKAPTIGDSFGEARLRRINQPEDTNNMLQKGELHDDRSNSSWELSEDLRTKTTAIVDNSRTNACE